MVTENKEKTAPRSGSKMDSTLLKLPPYTAPRTGILSYMPQSVLPFAELARIDKPGFLALWLAHAFGILHVGVLLHVPVEQILRLLGFFVFASQLLMSANFAWNDTCDVRYDGKVARTRFRPLVRGAVSIPAALIFDTVLAASLALLLIPLPRACSMYAIPMAVGCFFYPLTKRWTYYPQVFLAVVLSSGVFMGAAAAGATPLPYPSHLATSGDYKTWILPTWPHTVALMANYSTNVVWTVFFDVLYAFQDAKWDESAGVGTMTRLLKDTRSAKMFFMALASIQTASHAYVGIVTPMRTAFWPLSVGATFVTLAIEIFFVDLDRESSCEFWFAAGHLLTGSAMLVGYVGEYSYSQVMI